jgi:hypothetical protein
LALPVGDETANRVREAAPGKIEIVATPSGPAIRVAGFLTPQERQAAQQAMEPARAKAFAQAHVRHEAEYAARLSPAERVPASWCPRWWRMCRANWNWPIPTC